MTIVTDDEVERVARAMWEDADLRVMRSPWAMPSRFAHHRECYLALARAALAASDRDVLVADWQPIESAPRDGSIVWAANASNLCPAYFYVEAWRNWYKGPRYENVSLGAAAYAPEEIWFEPTHWQPLPEPPAALTPLGGEGR